jgi:hypothetical protein
MPLFQEPKPYWISIEEEEGPPSWDPVPDPWSCLPHPGKGKSNSLFLNLLFHCCIHIVYLVSAYIFVDLVVHVFLH